MAEKELACITGASGFVAGHIIDQLLKKGYKVRGTVRSIKDKEKLKFLYDLDPTGNSLELVEADLLNEESFDAAFKGCKLLFHTASPYILKYNDAEKELVNPAVQGTLNVLRAASKNGIKKVVLTSSVAAITDSPEENHVYTEKDWNVKSSLTRNPYYYSKKLAEEKAWEFVKEDKTFTLVVVNPFLILGPEFNPKTVNTSNQILCDILNGKFPGILDFGWGMVDVRDVAKAHILAMESDSAEGRYICWNRTISMKDTCKLLKERYPDFKKNIPSRDLACSLANVMVKLGSHFQDKGTGQYIRTNLGKHPQLDNAKVKSLGLEFIPLEQTLYDTVDDLIKKGHIDPPK
jgi:dihydroflavonol-4-reductase